MPRARVGSTPSGVSSTASRLEAGSVLTSSTRLPRSASATALAPATEVLPTPLLPVNSRWRGGVTRKGKVYRRLSSCGHPGFLDRSDDDSATRRHPRIGRRRPAHRRRRRPRGHGPCRAPTRRSPEAPAGWRRSGAPSWYGRRRSLRSARDADRDCHLGIERLRRRRRGRQAAKGLDQLGDQVGIERFERPFAAVEDGHLSIGPRRKVGELEGDVAAADEQHPPRQLVELEEPVARCDVLGAPDRSADRGPSGARRPPPARAYWIG